MKIKDYEKVKRLDAADTILVDTPDGVRTIMFDDLKKSIYESMQKYDVYDMLDNSIDYIWRNGIWRGKYLGDHVTDEQYAAMKAGTFKGMFLGDYWVINNHNWRIMDFNYWIRNGPVPVSDFHVVIMPDDQIANGVMNSTATNSTGYANSDFYKNKSNTVDRIVKEAFGDEHILYHKEYLITGVSNGGVPNAADWLDSGVELPNEFMIYGHAGYQVINYGGNSGLRISNSFNQLSACAMDQHVPYQSRNMIWLRDSVGTTEFASVGGYGNIDKRTANLTNGYRPVFAIKAA